MMERRSKTAMLLALAAVAVTVSPAATQLSKPPRDPAGISRKLERSAELQRQVLETLANPGQAERIAANAWTQLKSAHDDMYVNNKYAQFPDPLYAGSDQRLTQALASLQIALDTLRAHGQWTDSAHEVERVRSNVQKALRLTNIVAQTSF
jgi:hypothetical protein